MPYSDSSFKSISIKIQPSVFSSIYQSINNSLCKTGVETILQNLCKKKSLQNCAKKCGVS